MDKRVSLAQMEVGKSGKIVEIHGGQEMSLKLENLGIRVGEEIKKVNQQALRGPVVVEVGKSQVAIGFGMATKVLIEIADCGLRIEKIRNSKLNKEIADENTFNG